MTLISHDSLFGKNAFFNNPEYKEDLKKEFNNLKASCSYQSAQKTEKNITPSLGYLFKRLSKWSILPAVARPKNFGSILASDTSNWKYKRITMPIDGLSIDVAIMGRPSTLSNKKWILCSAGRNELYEDQMTSKVFKSFLESINSNAILFNYPKIGASTGPRNGKNMVTAYKAVLELLEDERNGIGAKKIIGYGYSMGGGVQGKALNTHSLEAGMKKGIQYLFIKDRTFSSLKRAIHSLSKGFIGNSIPLFGWDLCSMDSSKKLTKLQIPEIIVQTTDKNDEPNSDGVISKNASLKKAILESSLSHKFYVNIPNYNQDNLHACSMDCFSKELSEKVNLLIGDKEKTIYFAWISKIFHRLTS